MKVFLRSSKLLILIITSIIFSLSYFVGIASVIIYSLSFLILLEIIRTIVDYIIKSEHRVKIRYIIDGGLLFGMRELFVGWVMLKVPGTSGIILGTFIVPSALLGLVIMTISLISIGILINFRYKVIMSSPDKLEK